MKQFKEKCVEAFKQFLDGLIEEAKTADPMTPDEVRIKLGFKPFDEFEYDAFLNLKDRQDIFVIHKDGQKIFNKFMAVKERFRQTGRTTKIICDALSAISQGKQVILGGETILITKRLNQKLMAYAMELRLNTNLIRHINVSRQNKDTALHGYDLNQIKVFWDHPLP